MYVHTKVRTSYVVLRRGRCTYVLRRTFVVRLTYLRRRTYQLSYVRTSYYVFRISLYVPSYVRRSTYDEQTCESTYVRTYEGTTFLRTYPRT